MNTIHEHTTHVTHYARFAFVSSDKKKFVRRASVDLRDPERAPPLGARAGRHHRARRPSHGRRDARVPGLPRGDLRAAPHGPHVHARVRASRQHVLSVRGPARLQIERFQPARVLPAAPPGFLGDVDAHHLLEGREGAVYVHHTARHAHQVVPVVRELGGRHPRSLPGGGIDRPFRAADRDGVERAFVVAPRVVQLHLAVVRRGGED
mmetsp:Transcript_3750/g.15894  ORF Transcript_3750/g.15894 Transcript_3750/m.15894 type:complete len:207 (+) Transcript_3750:648-1268(+)